MTNPDDRNETAGAPILKWVGGKKRLLPQLTAFYTGQSTLVEPFFGGGALSFHLSGINPNLKVVANDTLAPLIDIYDAVRSDVETFITDVESYAAPYLAAGDKAARRKLYYEVRNAYLERHVDGPAPLFFMLWCAYSGLYRTGKTHPGRFNTSHGFGAEKPGFYHPERLRAAAHRMRDWVLSSGDFDQCRQYLGPDTLVLLDPPYRGTYTGYSDDGFTEQDQLRVVDFFKAADEAGATVVYTNKDLGDGFYDENFAGFHRQFAGIRYQVNANCADVGRPESREIIVSNRVSLGG